MKITKQPAGFGREQYVVRDGVGVVIGTADTEFQAEVVAMTHELRNGG